MFQKKKKKETKKYQQLSWSWSIPYTFWSSPYVILYTALKSTVIYTYLEMAVILLKS